ncbi:MAG: LysR family transcriptional regulator [Clostridiaceae bacterium]|nr:LysR family transcriptional regulator [Clostridiaceae bacterium]
MAVNLEWYRVFYQVARCGGITRAAQKLCITQPAVSQCVRQLEDALSCTLFLRTPKGVTLTDAGRALYDFVAPACQRIEAGEVHMLRLSGLEEGILSIGASDMTLEYYLLPHLQRFHTLWPGVRIHVTNAPTPDTMASLARGSLDCAAVSGPLEIEPWMEVTEALPLRDVFVAGPQFIHLKDRPLSAAEVCALPLICLEGNTSTRRALDQWARARNCLLRPEFELATSNLIVQFSLRGMGVGSVTDCFVQELLKTGALFELTLEDPPPVRHICLVTDRRSPPSAAAARLLSELKKDPPDTH